MCPEQKPGGQTHGRKTSISVKALVEDQTGRFLIIRRSMTSKNNRGMWDLPGGKLDPGESPVQALRRELAEELGLAVSVLGLAGTARSDLPDRVVSYEIYRCAVGARAPKVVLSDEHTEYKWIPRDELPGYEMCAQFVDFLRAYVVSNAHSEPDRQDQADRKQGGGHGL